MLQFLIDYAVPVTIFVSMLIPGAEIRAADLPNVVTATRTLVLGSADQLLVLPFVALLTQILAQPSQLVTTSLLLLALCQGGGISKYYSYVARCNVPVSATIPALSTILSSFYQLRLQGPPFSSVPRGNADRRIFGRRDRCATMETRGQADCRSAIRRARRPAALIGIAEILFRPNRACLLIYESSLARGMKCKSIRRCASALGKYHKGQPPTLAPLN
jgi:hypothetical protein